ncbi:MAG: DinB/UmuC family translesion DNA polymerase, partial [Nocardioidaceae bacterium]
TIGPWLIRLARGQDDSTVVGTPYVARSRSREITYQHDIQNWDEVRREVIELSRRVAADVAEQQRPASRIVVKVRYAPFTTHTHGHSLAQPAIEAAAIEQAALAAFGLFSERRPVRLLGVRAEFARPGQGRSQ